MSFLSPFDCSIRLCTSSCRATSAELEAVAAQLKMPIDKLRARVAELSEFNPMLGLRGSRLAIRYPEITEMQARAIFEAAIEAGKRLGVTVEPEIMIPLVAYRREYDILAGVIRNTADTIEKEAGVRLAYKLGTMIELPRACLRAGDLAEGEDGADFFSFGTNDLTQTALGLSRDDAAPILSAYATQGIYDADPFASIDQLGCGRAGAHRRGAGPREEACAQDRHLRRARRRPGLDHVLPQGRLRLTSPARRSACRLRGSRQRRPPSAPSSAR